jgi:hypothetical protein
MASLHLKENPFPTLTACQETYGSCEARLGVSLAVLVPQGGWAGDGRSRCNRQHGRLR